MPARSTGRFNTMRTHLKYAAQAAILNQVDPGSTDLYPFHCNPSWLDEITDFELPHPYAVVCTGYTSKVRAFPSQVCNAVIDDLLGRGITPVFLGKRTYFDGHAEYEVGFEDDIEYAKGVDLRGSTSLLEAFRVIRDALLVVGVDNGLMHVAYCTDTPVVGGFTTVDPKYRTPGKEGKICIVTPRGDCKFCQTEWYPPQWQIEKGDTTTLHTHDFMECFYEDFKCVNGFKAEDFVFGIETVLDERVDWV